MEEQQKKPHRKYNLLLVILAMTGVLSFAFIYQSIFEVTKIPTPSPEEIASVPTEEVTPVIEPPPPKIPKPKSSPKSDFFKVQTPELLPPPKLQSRKIDLIDTESLEILWRPVDGAHGYQVLVGANADEAQAFQVESGVTWNSSAESNFANLPENGNFWVQARDEWGRLGAKAKGRFAIKMKPRAPTAEVHQPTPEVIHSTPVVIHPAPEITRPAPAPAPAAPENIDPKKEVSDDSLKHFWLWLGSGMSYTNINQDAGSLSLLKLSAFRSGALVMRAGLWVTQQTGLDFSYKQTPGQALASPGLSLEQNTFTWKTASVEALYRNTAEDSQSSLTYRLGVQNHTIPFFVPQTSSMASVYENSILAASFGLQYLKPVSKKTKFEFLLRYQMPLAATSPLGSSYSVKSDFVFDGSLGATYAIKENLYFGLFWYGQWHKYRFDFIESTRGTEFSGGQSLFHSTVDLRLGVEF